MITIPIDGEDELLALWNVLAEAKFHDSPTKPEIQGSPYVASVSNRVYQLLIENLSEDKRHWFQENRTDHYVWPKLTKAAKLAQANSQMTPALRRKYLVDFAAPYLIKEDDISTLLDGRIT